MKSSWQDGCFNLKERLKVVFVMGFMCDMQFVVGKKKEKIPGFSTRFILSSIFRPAHRLVMSTASYKLARLVKKLTPNNNIIEVPNTTPSIFRIFLEYLYTGEILDNRTDGIIMIYVWQLAKHFSVKHLENLCRDYLCQVLSSDQANIVLKHSMALENHEAVEICRKVISEGDKQKLLCRKMDFCELLGSDKFSRISVCHKFSTIYIHEDIMNHCELQFQANQRIFVLGFGVFVPENSQVIGVLSLERLDVKKWDWVDHKFIKNYSIYQRCDLYGNEVVFFKINPPISAERKATYRLIFREADCLCYITGQQNIKENILIDFRTKFEQFSENSMAFLLQETQEVGREVLKEITGNEIC